MSELFYCGLAVFGVLMAMLMFCYKKTCVRLNHVVCEEMSEEYKSDAESSSGYRKFEEPKSEEEDHPHVKPNDPFMVGLTNQDL